MALAARALTAQAVCLLAGAASAELTGLSILYSAGYVLSFLAPAWMLAGSDRVDLRLLGPAYVGLWLLIRPVVDCLFGWGVCAPAAGAADCGPACVAGQIYDAFGPRMAIVTYPQFFEGFANVLDFLVNALPYLMGKTFQAAFGINWATVAAGALGTFLLHGTVALVAMDSLRGMSRRA